MKTANVICFAFFISLIIFQKAQAQTDTPTPTSTPEPNLKAGLVSCYELDEESGVRYDSYGSNDLSDYNTVGYTTGLIDNAALANNGEYLYRTPINFPSGDDPISVFFWIKDFDITNKILYFGALSGDGCYRVYIRIVTGDLIQFWCGATGYTTALNVNTGSWNLIGYTYDGSSTTKIYRNTSSSNYSMVFAIVPDYFNLANYVVSNQSVDLLMLWDRTLSDSNITELYNSGAGLSCEYITSIADPTATPTLTPTPSNERQVELSSGDWMIVKREVTYGELSVSILLAVVLFSFAIFAIINTVDRWIRK